MTRTRASRAATKLVSVRVGHGEGLGMGTRAMLRKMTRKTEATVGGRGGEGGVDRERGYLRVGQEGEEDLCLEKVQPFVVMHAIIRTIVGLGANQGPRVHGVNFDIVAPKPHAPTRLCFLTESVTVIPILYRT